MNFDWQNLTALTIVLAAAAYVGRHAWRVLAQRSAVSGCGRCASCPSKRATDQLVTLSVRQP